MTNQQLQEIKDRLEEAKRLWASGSVFSYALIDIAALIAAYEEKAAEVERLRWEVQATTKLAAKLADAISEGKGKITFPQDEHGPFPNPPRTF